MSICPVSAQSKTPTDTPSTMPHTDPEKPSEPNESIPRISQQPDGEPNNELPGIILPPTLLYYPPFLNLNPLGAVLPTRPISSPEEFFLQQSINALAASASDWDLFPINNVDFVEISEYMDLKMGSGVSGQSPKYVLEFRIPVDMLVDEVM